MANFAKFQDEKQTVTNRYSFTKWFDWVMVIAAFSHAQNI